jgi:hypothetical protein
VGVPAWPSNPAVAANGHVGGRRLQSAAGIRIMMRVIIPSATVNDTKGDGEAVIQAHRIAIAKMLAVLNASIVAGGMDSAFKEFFDQLSVATGLPASSFGAYVDQDYIVTIMPQPRWSIPDPPPPIFNEEESASISASIIIGSLIFMATFTYLIRMRYARGGRLPGDKKAWEASKATELELLEDKSTKISATNPDIYSDIPVSYKRNREAMRKHRAAQARRTDQLRQHVAKQVRRMVNDPALKRRLERSRTRSQSRSRALVTADATYLRDKEAAERRAQEEEDLEDDEATAAAQAAITAQAAAESATMAAVAGDLTRLPAAPLGPNSATKGGTFHLSRMLGETSHRLLPADSELGAQTVEEEGHDADLDGPEAGDNGLDAEADAILTGMVVPKGRRGKPAHLRVDTGARGAGAPHSEISPAGDRIIAIGTAVEPVAGAEILVENEFHLPQRDRKLIERHMRSHGLELPPQRRKSITSEVRAALDSDSLLSTLQAHHMADVAQRRRRAAQLQDEDERDENDNDSEGHMDDMADDSDGGAYEDGQSGSTRRKAPGPSAAEVMAMIDKVTSIPSPPGEETVLGSPMSLYGHMFDGTQGISASTTQGHIESRTLPPLVSVPDSMPTDDVVNAELVEQTAPEGAESTTVEDDGSSAIGGGGSAFSKPNSASGRPRRTVEETIQVVPGQVAPVGDDAILPAPRATRLDLMPSAEDVLERVRKVYDQERARVASDAPIHIPTAPVLGGAGYLGGGGVSPNLASRPGVGAVGRRNQQVRRIDSKLYSSPYLDSAAGAAPAPRGGARVPSAAPTAGPPGGRAPVPVPGARSESPVAGIAWPDPDLRGGVPTVSAQGRRDNYLAAYAAVTSPLGAGGSQVVSPLTLSASRPSLGPSVLSPSSLLPGARSISSARSGASSASRYGAAALVPGSASRRGELAPTVKASGIVLDSASTSELVLPDSPDKSPQRAPLGDDSGDEDGAGGGGSHPFSPSHAW